MQLRQPSPDALVSFSDFLLERFGLVATMQVAMISSIAVHALLIVGLGFKMIPKPDWDAPNNVMDVVLVNSKSAAKPVNADALTHANLERCGSTDQKLSSTNPPPPVALHEPSPT